MISKIFEFVSKVIDGSMKAYEKYNGLVQIANETEHKYSKLLTQNESQQRESKFMAEHLGRISEDKI
jgi:hypothetical protein